MSFLGNTYSLPIIQHGSPLFFMFSPIYHPAIKDGPRLPALIIQGGSKHDLLLAQKRGLLDWELKGADQPFDSLDELLGFLGLPSLAQIGDQTTLEIAMRSPAMISDTSGIVKGKAIIKCRVAATLDPKKIKLGIKILHRDSTDRSFIQGDHLEWTVDGNFRIGTAKIDVGEAPLAQTFISYNGTALHQWWILDAEKRLNARHAIYEVFDADLKLIRQFLFSPSKKDDRAFEHGVALLLDLFGFSVSHHGTIKKLEDGPDIIAITPIGNVGVIECTTGLLDEDDKLAKLVKRTKLIKERLSKSGYGYLGTYPVIISALSRNEVEAHLEEAGKNGIAVICKENLENLLTRVSFPPNPDSLLQEALQLIPGSGQQSLFKESN